MNILKFICLTLITLSMSFACMADKLEVGIGVFSTSLPDYVGSDEQQRYMVPFPYFYYKSERLEINRSIINSTLWEKNNWHLDLSANGSLPTDSDQNNARKGMDDLDFVGELGPVLKYFLQGNTNTEKQLSIALYIRKAIATDFSSIEDIGWRYGTSFAFQQPLESFLAGSLQFNSTININFSNEKYLNYYYGVSGEHVQIGRSYYQANSGYSGSDFSLGLSWKREKIWIGSFIKYHMLYDTTQQNSPLVKKNNNWSLGLGFSWVFYQK